MAFMTVWAKLGTFGEIKWVPAPWDEIAVIAVSIPFYYWAVASGHPTHALEEAQAVADEADRAWDAHLP